MKETRKNQEGSGHITLVLLIVVIAVIGLVGWKVWDSNKGVGDTTPNITSGNSRSSPSDNITSNSADYITLEDWGVRFPVTKVGQYFYRLPTSGLGATPEITNGGPSDMQYVYINVSGLSKEENRCVEDSGEVLGIGSVFRHKEQNPTIKYMQTTQLNPVAQVKIGDWYYSTKGLDGSGNCFEGKPTSSDYKKLQSEFLENFKKLEEY